MRAVSPCDQEDRDVHTFYLGTHRPHWLSDSAIPLFVSDTTLRRYRTLPRATHRWALDSGAFSQISHHGGWDDGPTPAQYAARVRRYRDEIGHLDFASPQDYMCEPPMLARTGLTVQRHIELTVANFLDLKSIDATLPVVPVLQGWQVDDYERCHAHYARHGVDLAALPVVGVGSVCRRQATREAVAIFGALHRAGLRNLHAYGVKTLGLNQFATLLASADSLAWSRAARYEPRLPGCQHTGHCGNCRVAATRWYATITSRFLAANDPDTGPEPARPDRIGAPADQH
jgi:hypothetical protein